MTARPLRAVASLALAVAAVSATGTVERPTDEWVVYNNVCTFGPDPAACLEPRTAAGLPFAFVYDTPGVSVEHAAHPFEDEVRPGPFWLGVLVVGVVAFGAWSWAARGRSRTVRPRALALGAGGAVVVLGVLAASGAVWAAFVGSDPPGGAGWEAAGAVAWVVQTPVFTTLLMLPWLGGDAALYAGLWALRLVLALGVGAVVALAAPPGPVRGRRA